MEVRYQLRYSPAIRIIWFSVDRNSIPAATTCSHQPASSWKVGLAASIATIALARLMLDLIFKRKDWL